MKKVKFLGLMLAMLVASMSFVGCSDDKDDEILDFASQVAGVYTGKLKVDSRVIEDAYVVTVTKISSTVVKVTANFYSSSTNNSENFNVEKTGSLYIFTSASSSGQSISVTGKEITISFINGLGGMTTFTGTKD